MVEKIVAWVGLIIAVVLAIKELIMYRNDSIRSRRDSPCLMIDELLFRHNSVEKFSEGYNLPNSGSFYFEKRTYHEINNDSFVLKGPEAMMVIKEKDLAACEIKEYINFNLITIQNIGIPAKSMEIVSFTFFTPSEVKNKDEKITILPQLADSRNTINKRIDSNNPLKIYFSMYLNEKSQLFDTEKLKEEIFIKQKLEKTGGQLLGISLSDRVDKWKRIEILIVVTSIYGDKYKQTLILESEPAYDAQYTSPKRIFNYTYKRLKRKPNN